MCFQFNIQAWCSSWICPTSCSWPHICLCCASLPNGSTFVHLQSNQFINRQELSNRYPSPESSYYIADAANILVLGLADSGDIANSLDVSECIVELVKIALINSGESDLEGTMFLTQLICAYINFLNY